MFSLILFCSEVNTLDDIWLPEATTSTCCSSPYSSTNFNTSSSSSSGLLRFWYFLCSGFDLRNCFGGVSASFLNISPVTYGRSATIRLFFVYISFRNSFGWQHSTTRFPSSTSTRRVPPELSTSRKMFDESLSSYSIL